MNSFLALIRFQLSYASILLSDLDNCKWSGPDFWRFAIKKFAIIKKFFLFNNYFIENSGKVFMPI